MILCIHCVKESYCQDHEESTFRYQNRMVMGHAVGCEHGEPKQEELTNYQKVMQIIDRHRFTCINVTDAYEVWENVEGDYIERIEIDKVYEKIYSNITGYFAKGDTGYTYKSFLSTFGKQ